MSEGQSNFKFPDVKRGDVVLFLASPSDQETHPMIVINVGDESIDGIVMWGGNSVGGQTPRTGVRHVGDPWLRDVTNAIAIIEENEGGCFVENPSTVELRERVAELCVTVDGLEETLAAAIQAFNTTAPKEAQLAMPEVKKRGRPKKEPEAVPEAPKGRLSDFIGGGGPPAKVDEQAKRAALAAAR